MRTEHLHRKLVAGGLERWAWPLAEAAVPAVQLGIVLSDEKLIPPGVSKFGGTPHVPADFTWPVDRTGKPLSFLAQIHFAEFSPFQWMGWHVPVPGEGLVSFFARQGGMEADQYQIFFFDQPRSLVRWDDPHAADSPARQLLNGGIEPPDRSVPCSPPRSLSFQQCLSLPSAQSPAIESIGMEPQEVATYEAFRDAHNSTGGRHQVLGFPWKKIPARGETVLLQLDSELSLGWNWPGDGVLTFLVDDNDLQACRFDRVRPCAAGG